MRLEDKYPSLLADAVDSPSSNIGAFLPFSFELFARIEHHDASGAFRKAVNRFVESDLISQELRRVLVAMFELQPWRDGSSADSPKKLERLRSEVRGMGVDLDAVSPGSFFLDRLPEDLYSFYRGLDSFASPKAAIGLRLPEPIALHLGATRVASGSQLVAVAMNRGFAKDVSVDGLCGELWILNTEVSAGSVVARGNGVLIWIAGTILVPIAIAAFGKEISDPAKEALQRMHIQRNLSSVKGRCVLEGHVQLELDALSRSFEASVFSRSSRGVCVEQAALTIVGRSPGAIDGVDGPQTDAARRTFKQMWGVVDKVPISQEYVSALLKALKGSQPPNK